MNHSLSSWALPIIENDNGYIYFRLREPNDLYIYVNNININIYDECLNPACNVRHKISLVEINNPNKVFNIKKPLINGPLRHKIWPLSEWSPEVRPYPHIKKAIYNVKLCPRIKCIPKWSIHTSNGETPFASFSNNKRLSIFNNPYLNVLYRVKKNISLMWDHPEIFYDNNWYVVNDWKVNRHNGVITHKIETIIRHQYINGIDLSIVRCDFNILVPYFALKLLVLLKRARTKIVRWMCLRNIYKKNNCKLLNHYLSGYSNYTIRRVIFKEFL